MYLDKLTTLLKLRGSDGSLRSKSLLAFVLRAGGMLAQYLFIFVVARLYGPAEQGTFTLAFTLLQLFAILAQLGLDTRLVRVIAGAPIENKNQIVNTSYRQSLIITAVSAFIWSLLSWYLAPWFATTVFSKPHLASRIQLISLSLLPFVLMGFNSSAFRGFKNMTGFLLFRALIPLLGVIFIIITYFTKLPFGAIESHILATTLICIASFVAWNRMNKYEGETVKPSASAREVISDSLPLMLTGSMFFILGWTDNLILGIFRSEADVGIYDTAFKLSTLSAILLLSINAIQAPVYAELYARGEHKKLQRSVFTSTRMLFYASFPVTLILCVFPAPILGTFGPAFREAAPALIILSLGNFVNSITGSIGILLQMSGRQKQYNRIILTAAAGSILLNFILIPRMGILGAAVSSAAAKIFQNTASVIYAKRSMNIVSVYLPGISRLIRQSDDK